MQCLSYKTGDKHLVQSRKKNESMRSKCLLPESKQTLNTAEDQIMGNLGGKLFGNEKLSSHF